MDLNHLFSQHQISLIRLAHAADAAARDLARECADDYAGRITAMRDRLGVKAATFDFRQLAA